MKPKWLFTLALSAVFLAVCGLFLLPSPTGANPAPATPFLALSAVCVPEMPAKAAALVHAADPLQRAQTVQDTLHAIAMLAKPGLMPYVVSAICAKDPDMAATAVLIATELQRDDAGRFCLAALCAAPAQLEPIVTAACEAAPADFADVAVAAVERAPSQKALILQAVTNAVPDVQRFLDAAEIRAGTDDLEPVMQQTVLLMRQAAESDTNRLPLK
jgi:hypothetical protein